MNRPADMKLFLDARDESEPLKSSRLSQPFIPVEPYYGSDQYALEVDRIFKKVWLFVGRVEQIPEPGDYFLKRIECANTSLIIARQTDGGVRAIHNMCSHRGNPVALEEEDHCKTFTCAFHGWTYNCDGSLKSMTEPRSVFNRCKRTDWA